MGLTTAGATALAAGISATASTGTAIAGGKMNQRSAREARRTRQWQTAEREASQQWALEQWNRENAYNSPANQIKLFEEAGLNPLSYINGNVSEASSPSAPSDPSGAMAQFQNPLAYSQGSLNGIADSFIQYKALQMQEKQIDKQSEKLDSDIEYQAALTKTVNEMRQGEVDFLGVKINLGKKESRNLDIAYDKEAQLINQSKKECEQILQFMEESKARVSMMSWEKFCQWKKLPYELKLLGQQVLHAKYSAAYNKQLAISEYHNRPEQFSLLQNQAYQSGIQSKMMAHYFQNYSNSDMYNSHKILSEQTKQSQYQTDQMKGGTYSQGSYALKRGMSITEDLLRPFVDALKGYMYYSIGNKGLNFQKSTPNPQPLQPNMPGVGY